jgi:hypothetical protein
MCAVPRSRLLQLLEGSEEEGWRSCYGLRSDRQ